MSKFFRKKQTKQTDKAPVKKAIKKEKKPLKPSPEKSKPQQEKKEKPQPEAKKANPRKMVYFGKGGSSSIKEQMTKVWGQTVKKLMQLSPEELQKEIQNCEYTPFQKNQIGTMINGAIKKQLQVGVKSDHYIYDSNQQKTYNAAYEKASKMTNKALQEILRKNDQTITDKKEKLVERVADGETLGRIPRCPICFGNKKGIYMCPGYVDGGDNCVKGDDYIFCNKTFKLNEITREKWE